ncbi:MAG: vWA domain-containing protein, partial [Bryobacteraceae bacterium]
SAQSAFTMESVSADQASSVQPSKYAFVVLSDVRSLPSSFENNLARYVRGGGGVLIAAGTGIGRASRIPLFDANILDSHYYSNGPGGYLTVGDTDPSHPSIAKADRWADVKFYYAVKVDDSGSQVAARLTDGTPLLLDKKIGEGRVLLLASGLDNLTNDFPLHPDFVPFVEQTAFYLSGSERPGGSQLVGSFLQLRTAKERAVSVEVVDPQGRRPLSLQEATTAQTYQLNDAGFYELRLANGRQDVVGVNADRRESDLAVMSPDALSLWSGKPQSAKTAASAITAASTFTSAPQKFDAHSLWWYVMLLVLLTAIVESWAANLHLGVRREE